MPPHPTSVPAEATYIEEMIAGQLQGFWQVGHKSGEHCVGEWIFWRADGTLYQRERYDAQGELDGLRAFYHPNGEVAQETPYKGGRAHGEWWGQQSALASDQNWRLVMSS